MWGHWLREAKYILYVCMDKDEYVKVGLAYSTELGARGYSLPQAVSSFCTDCCRGGENVS